MRCFLSQKIHAKNGYNASYLYKLHYGIGFLIAELESAILHMCAERNYLPLSEGLIWPFVSYSYKN